LLTLVAVFHILFVENFSFMRAKSGICIISTLAVLLGGTIYVLFRNSNIIAVHWMSSIGMESWIQEIRSLELGGKLTIPQWIVYTLPNGLWAFAYTLIIFYLWIRHSSWIKWVWLSTIPTLVFGFEMLQYLNILPGTFSMGDLLSGLTGVLAGALVGIKIQKNRKHEKAFV
jgi:hypothetical protein